MKTPVLRLVRERKLEDLLDPPSSGAKFEASGVIAQGEHCYVVLDNVRRVARVALHLRPGSSAHRWVATNRQGEGYEAITFDRAAGRFYLMIEAQKHPDGTFKGAIDEYDTNWRYRGRRWIDHAFDKRNTGFEGLASLHWRGSQYLLALCEGNTCRQSRKKKTRGQGRIHVLQRRGRVWRPVGRIKLPPHVAFKDYSDLTLRGTRLGVVSQESSRLWVGSVRAGQWKISGKGRIYLFPRSRKGKKRYHTVEGISWLSARTFVAVSDLRKKRHAKRSRKTDQSVHVFRLA